jgi:hypothetical protein
MLTKHNVKTEIQLTDNENSETGDCNADNFPNSILAGMHMKQKSIGVEKCESTIN